MDSRQFSTEYISPLGPLTIAADGQRITGLWLKGQKYYAATLGRAVAGARLPVFEQAADWLDRYFRGEKPQNSLPLAPPGSAFRQAVWRLLGEIPYGRVFSYGEIARAVAREMGRESMSAQAVGGAVGHNPISIIIPCHRVVGSNGSLTGYAGGLDKKIHLLRLEGADLSSFFIPARGTAL